MRVVLQVLASVAMLVGGMFEFSVGALRSLFLPPRDPRRIALVSCVRLPSF